MVKFCFLLLFLHFLKIILVNQDEIMETNHLIYATAEAHLNTQFNKPATTHAKEETRNNKVIIVIISAKTVLLLIMRKETLIILIILSFKDREKIK